MIRSSPWRSLVWWLSALFGTLACAHESMPASLLLRQSAAQRFEVQWRLPQTQGRSPDIRPEFPADCVNSSAPREEPALGARRLRWSVDCQQGLRSNAGIRFAGLPLTLVDVLVQIVYLDGQSETQVARPRTPEVVLRSGPAPGPAVSAFLGLGIEHILTGVDHLLFVTCLILLSSGLGGLLKTVTAFTLAHSVTLVGSALGWVHVPQPPVEATIALSILFLARELARPDAQQALAQRRPWLVAFVFGLLHGFGFAGALSEIGLPQDAIALALLLFNLGVEIGQLLFVAAVVPLVLLKRKWLTGGALWVHRLPVYAVGSVAGFWWLQRMGPVLGNLARGAI